MLIGNEIGGCFVKKLLHSLLSVLVIVSLLASFTPQAQAKDIDLGLPVSAAILIDANSGKILYEQNADTPLGIASLTKLMTQFLLFDAIKAGTVTWEQEYEVTDSTYEVSQNRILSNVPLRRDGAYTVRELYEAMAIYSANAATMGIAEIIAGSETEFVKLMNEKAELLGLQGYKFANSTGLNNSYLNGKHPAGTGASDENIMPAKYVAKLTYALLKEHPEVLETASIAKKVFREGTSDAIDMPNRNLMLPGSPYEYEGVDGLKTGTTEFAGHNFVGTAKRGDTRLIAVVLNAVDAKTGVATPASRFEATAKLFDYGFEEFDLVEIVPAHKPIQDQETIRVIKGTESKVEIAALENINMMVKSSEKDLYTMRVELNEEPIEAPIKKGTVVGQLIVEHKEGNDYGFIDGKELAVDVVAMNDVKRSGKFSLFLQGVGDFFVNLWDSSTAFVDGIL